MTHDHDRGLAFDMSTLMSRRRALGVLTASVLVAGCGSKTTTSSSTPTPSAEEIPDETAGPFPGDGSNGPNVLTESGVVRSDITKSFGGASGVADGVPTRLEMTLLDVAKGGTPLAGAAVYVWHCDRVGRYSIYDNDANYLRGVQESGKDGKVAFTSIFPGAYSGRWPHIHFEVYDSLQTATAAGSKLKTSQIALPQDTCERVYATAGYEESVANLAQTSLDGDMVFGDGYASQLAGASGSDAITLRLNVGV